jgi:hypothetical protein
MATLDMEWLLPGHGPVIKSAVSIQKNFDFIRKMYFGQM